ncbi:amidohydrolase family protein [Devosia sp.]|jgi:5-methylthioadenosine/S-adenosylhomocysteine deaminase|uniref:amidohydrolase family protein n=1 Tax=Devosia sp. TaxID=1871048 RepID=UPI0037C0106C
MTSPNAIHLVGATIVPGAKRPVITGDILIVGQHIAAVGGDLSAEARAAGAQVLDCRERLAIPGFVNAHTHSNESFEQGFYDALPLEVWLLWKYPPAAIARLPERVHYLRTMLLAIQCVRSGITTVQDDLINQLSDPAAFDGSAAAYRDLGLRANVTTSIWDKPPLASLLWTDELMTPEQKRDIGNLPSVHWRDQIALFERNAGKWDGAGAGRIRTILGPVGPQWCSDDLLQVVTEISVNRRCPVHTHTLESRMHAVQGEALYGTTIIEHLHRLGVLQPHFTLNHAVWLTDTDIERIGAAGCSITHNPLSNLKLGSGVARVRDMLSAGIAVGLGTDGTSTSDRADAFRSLGMAALLHRVADQDYETWVTADDAFEMATLGAARTAGLADVVGVIEPGRLADITLIDRTDYGLIPLKRPVSQLAYAVNSDAVRTVIVDGRVVMLERELTTIDEVSIKAEIREEAERYLRDHVPLMELQAAKYESYYRAAHMRAAGIPVPADGAPIRVGCTCHPVSMPLTGR